MYQVESRASRASRRSQGPHADRDARDPGPLQHPPTPADTRSGDAAGQAPAPATARGGATDGTRATVRDSSWRTYTPAIGVAVAPLLVYVVATRVTTARSLTFFLILLPVVLGVVGVGAHVLSAGVHRQLRLTDPGREIGQLRARVERLSQCLVHLNVFAEALSDTPDVQTLLARLVPMVERTFDADWSTLHMIADEGNVKAIGALHGSHDPATVALNHVIAHGQPVCIPHPQGQHSPLPVDLSSGLGSLVAVPLVAGGRVTGALAVGTHEQREFSQRETSILSTIAAQIAIAVESATTYRRLESSYLATVSALASAMEANDEYTADHAEIIAKMAIEVGGELGLDDSELRQLRHAGLLHDIGKIGIPDPVLHKGGALSTEEAATMAKHTVIGERILSQVDHLRSVAPLVRAAHERWDGRGYPDGLEGDAIPLASRIVFVCDAFHAMTSDRPYRRALSAAEALEELRAQAGRQFDPRIVEAFARILPAIAGQLEPSSTRSHASFATASSLAPSGEHPRSCPLP